MRYRLCDIEITEPLVSLEFRPDEAGAGLLLRRNGRPIGFLIEEKGDRVIYNWGKHKILNGLELELTQTFMHVDNLSHDKFAFIDNWEVGDKKALESFKMISEHLTKELGQPSAKDEQTIPDKFWTWNLGTVKVQLHLFEQHAFKLNLRIKNENV